MKIIVVILLAIAALLGGWFAYMTTGESQPMPETTSDIEELRPYLAAHLSELSPEKEVLGGSFYLTDLVAEGGRGTVSYEDGHIALVADFTYSLPPQGDPIITSFTLR